MKPPAQSHAVSCAVRGPNAASGVLSRSLGEWIWPVVAVDDDDDDEAAALPSFSAEVLKIEENMAVSL